MHRTTIAAFKVVAVHVTTEALDTEVIFGDQRCRTTGDETVSNSDLPIDARACRTDRKIERRRKHK